MVSLEKLIAEQQIYFIIEAAGWTHGAIQAKINDFVCQLIKRLRRIQGEVQEDLIIKVSVIEYSTHCRWVPECTHTPVADIAWPGILSAGLSDLGSALKEIEKELSELDIPISLDPIYIFIAGGLPTDNYQDCLTSLNSNSQYQRALKIAFGIPSLIGYDNYLLAELTGSADRVFDFDQVSLFTPLIKRHLESNRSEK